LQGLGFHNLNGYVQGFGSLEVELHRTDGARLRIHSPDASLPLAAIVHSFLEAR
jgi:hypothetical protein